MSNDLKCRDRWQGDSMSLNNFFFFFFFKAFRLGKARALADAQFILQTNRSVLHPLRCFRHAEQLRLDDSNMKWALSLVKVWWPGDAGAGRCRRVLRGQAGPTASWQLPVGTAVSTPAKVSLVWPCTPSTSIISSTDMWSCPFLSLQYPSHSPRMLLSNMFIPSKCYSVVWMFFYIQPKKTCSHSS